MVYLLQVRLSLLQLSVDVKRPVEGEDKLAGQGGQARGNG
jgi:hypothetical protein